MEAIVQASAQISEAFPQPGIERITLIVRPALRGGR